MSKYFDTTMQNYDKSEIEAMDIPEFEKENLKRVYSGFPELTQQQFKAMNDKMAKDVNSLNNSNIF